MFRARILTFLLVLLAVQPVAAQPVSFDLAPDVPSDLSGTTFLPSEVVRFDAAAGTHALAVALAGEPALDALFRMDGGDWLFSVESAADLGGTTFDGTDVVRFDGALFTTFLDGAAAGIPAGANVDALFLDGGDGGDLVLSFDVPTTLGGTNYGPADLVRHAGGVFSPFLDAAAAGIPPGSNVTGADRRGGLIVLAFDIPTDLGGTTYLPGELVGWDGFAFATVHSDPAWPESSLVNGFAFPPDPGAVTSLTVDSGAGGDVVLSWSASCSSGATDYAIYEGAIGSWYSHTQVDCSDDGGDRTESLIPGAGNRYFLVVPHNAPNDEGSYGIDSAGAERPAGLATCVPTRVLGTCS